MKSPELGTNQIVLYPRGHANTLNKNGKVEAMLNSR